MEEKADGGLKSEVNNLTTDLSKLSKDVSSIGADVLNLKEKIKSSKDEKIITVKEKPVKCKNCRKNPCLNGEPVTVENFVDGAHFEANSTKGIVHGYTHIGDNGDKWIRHWTEEQQEATEVFTKKKKSLRYSC